MRSVGLGVDPPARNPFNGSALDALSPSGLLEPLCRLPSVGGFRLGDDWGLVQLYRIYGVSSIGIGQVRSGFYGCVMGWSIRQSSVHHPSVKCRLLYGFPILFLVRFGLSSVSWLTLI